ncbi:unnamed protein product [Thlaspi arvense]|uniref:Bet v I/Major latex protein domain-containing protein n=1 Tax=Thlaspi arvense TaxID=13288 RepID=A0AAU9S4U5_THLAR|nr:unnamed protein product [Thlaspi arvense]
MGMITYETEITSSIPPAKLFKSFVLDANNLIPKVFLQAIKSVEILEGDGGLVTIKLATFSEAKKAQSHYRHAKQRIDGIDKENFTYCYSIIEGDGIDKENFTYCYSIIEGDALGETVESISYETKILPSPEGGSICKNTSKHHTKGDAHLTEEEIKCGKEKSLKVMEGPELSSSPVLAEVRFYMFSSTVLGCALFS